MRLNRFLATAGLGSRRGVEELIEKGRVRVNGTLVTDLATTVKPTDVIKVGNKVVRPEHTIHAVINKPRGYVCSADDEQERRTIYELLPPNWPRVFHVGRLDMESEGLLIMTNDGDLSLALTHPKYKVPKEYEVVLDRPFDPAHSEKLLRGFHIIGGRAKMEAIELISGRRMRLILHQGIKRQIRLMMYEMGYEVESLKRLRIGNVELGNLPPGACRLLTKEEVEGLRASTSATGAKVPTARTITAGFKDLRPADRRGKGPTKRVKPSPEGDASGLGGKRSVSKDVRPAGKTPRPGSRPVRREEKPDRSSPGSRGRREDFERRPSGGDRRPSERGAPRSELGTRGSKRGDSQIERRDSQPERGGSQFWDEKPRSERQPKHSAGGGRQSERDQRRSDDRPRPSRGGGKQSESRGRQPEGRGRQSFGDRRQSDNERRQLERRESRSDDLRGYSDPPRSRSQSAGTFSKAPRSRSEDFEAFPERVRTQKDHFAPRSDRKPSPGFRAPAGRSRPPRPGGGGPAKPRAPRGR